ncbi:hypothetical protein amrb99_75940 [Actinomadura sp. RB99]|nr:hypothetical protein [Actinomadura sp. RB99]
MVEPEQLLQLLDLDVAAALHGVQHGQLPVHERLGAAGQAEQDVADAAAQFRLLDGGADRGLLDGVERASHLPDLVAAELQRRRLHRHVHLLAVPEALDDAGQPLLGQLPRGDAQPFELPDEGARRGDRHDDGRDDREKPETTGEEQSDDHSDRDRLGLVDDPVTALQHHLLQCGLDGLRRGPPVLGADAQRRPGTALLDPVLDGAHPLVGGAVQHVLVVGALGRSELRRGLLMQEPLRADERHELGVLAGQQPARGERAGEQRVLPREDLLGACQGVERPAVLRDGLVIDAPGRVVDAERGVDEVVEGLDGRLAIDPVRIDGGPGAVEAGDVGEGLLDAFLEVVARRAGDVSTGGEPAELGRLLPDERALLRQRLTLGDSGGGDVDDREPALLLQVGDQVHHRSGHLLVDRADREKTEALPHGHPRGERPQGDQRGEHGRDLGPQTRVADAHQPVLNECRKDSPSVPRGWPTVEPLLWGARGGEDHRCAQRSTLATSQPQ